MERETVAVAAPVVLGGCVFRAREDYWTESGWSVELLEGLANRGGVSD